MFVLKRFISRDGDSEDETILVISETPESVRDKWNNYVTKFRKEYNERNCPPEMLENELGCSKSYSGGGCYAVFRYKVVKWEDKLNN